MDKQRQFLEWLKDGKRLVLAQFSRGAQRRSFMEELDRRRNAIVDHAVLTAEPTKAPQPKAPDDML